MSESKKNCTELTEEELDKVSGGYSREHWEAMTTQERMQADAMSDVYRDMKMYCAMDDPNA